MSWDIFSKSKIQYFLEKLKGKFVQKETGKGLSSNDYTTTDKNKVALIDNTTTSATGNPISIADLKSAQIALNPVITFEPIQAGSGTPSPSNIRAISGYDKIEVLSCGKNLLNADTLRQGDYNNTTSTVRVSQNVEDRIKTIAGKTYTCSFTATATCKTQWVILTDATNTITDQVAIAVTTNVTFTAPRTGDYICTIYGGEISGGAWTALTLADAKAANPQIEEGSTSTTYVPYHKTTDLSESLGQTVYGLTDDVRSGLCTDIWTKIDMSTLSWGYNGTQKRYEADLPNAKSVGSGRSDKIVCSKYATDIDAAAGDSWKVFQSGRTVFVYDNDRTGNPTGDVAYILADVTIQLTPHEIALSQGYNYISTNGTNISLAYHNGELATHADVEQLAETVNKQVAVIPGMIVETYNVGSSVLKLSLDSGTVIMLGRSSAGVKGIYLIDSTGEPVAMITASGSITVVKSDNQIVITNSTGVAVRITIIKSLVL